MDKLSDEQAKSLLEATYELRSREYKSPFRWSDDKSLWLREKVIRAVLGLSNTRTGGNLIIGVSEDKIKKSLSLDGLSEEQLSSFNDFDGIKGHIDGFSYTDTDFQIAWGEYEKKKYVVFTVQEFYEIPLVCKKPGQTKGTLIKDDIYVRSKKAPYSTIKATDLELREIIKMAVDKEKEDLGSRGWIKKGKVDPAEYFNNKLKDLEL